MNPTINHIVKAIDDFARPCWQEDFDNSGWQILLPGAENEQCTGVMICVDVTPEIVREAVEKNCNLILTHHPLLFRGLKRIADDDRVGQCVIEVIKAGTSVYSCHTPVDSAPGGVSFKLAGMLQLADVEVLKPGCADNTGLGVVGCFTPPITFQELITLLKAKLSTPVVRCSNPMPPDATVHKIAIGGGACADLIPLAVKRGAQVMVTSDVKHNFFIDYAHAITVVDLGHFETEVCTKEIFYDIIKEKFPNFATYYSQTEKNPINYL